MAATGRAMSSSPGRSQRTKEAPHPSGRAPRTLHRGRGCAGEPRAWSGDPLHDDDASEVASRLGPALSAAPQPTVEHLHRLPNDGAEGGRVEDHSAARVPGKRAPLSVGDAPGFRGDRGPMAQHIGSTFVFPSVWTSATTTVSSPYSSATGARVRHEVARLDVGFDAQCPAAQPHFGAHTHPPPSRWTAFSDSGYSWGRAAVGRSLRVRGRLTTRVSRHLLDGRRAPARPGAHGHNLRRGVLR